MVYIVSFLLTKSIRNDNINGNSCIYKDDFNEWIANKNTRKN